MPSLATAATRGPIARRHPFNYQQSLGRYGIDTPVPGRVSLQVTEENARRYYGSWADYMDGGEWGRLLGADDSRFETAAN